MPRKPKPPAKRPPGRPNRGHTVSLGTLRVTQATADAIRELFPGNAIDGVRTLLELALTARKQANAV